MEILTRILDFGSCAGGILKEPLCRLFGSHDMELTLRAYAYGPLILRPVCKEFVATLAA